MEKVYLQRDERRVVGGWTAPRCGTVDTEPAALQDKDKGLWLAENYIPRPAGQFRLPLQLRFYCTSCFFGLVGADDWPDVTAIVRRTFGSSNVNIYWKRCDTATGKVCTLTPGGLIRKRFGDLGLELRVFVYLTTLLQIPDYITSNDKGKIRKEL